MTSRSSIPICLWAILTVATPVLLSAAPQQTDLATISATVTLRTGGTLSGAVLDHNQHAVVLLSKDTPYVFAWTELDAAAAVGLKRRLLEHQRGGAKQLSADDHYQLGKFALEMGRNDLASNAFDAAKKMNPRLRPRIQAAYEEFRRSGQSGGPGAQMEFDSGNDKLDANDSPGAPRPPSLDFEALPAPSEQVRADVREVYLRFGEKVREVLGPDIRLVESPHFLIWTDWGPKEQSRLTDWCEKMYEALCGRFGLDAKEDIFLAKCPVFCFRSKARFKRFARDFDGYDAINAIGYTRSIEKNGHVHMAFARMGSTPADYDRFACTLVHEGTHAFLHRLHGTRLLPHWVNEGYAELTAERVLGDRCPAGENAALLARQYARFDWTIQAFLSRESTIEVHEYPLAHSIVAHLETQNPSQFASLIRDLKQGMPLPSALEKGYSGLTFQRLEKEWKQSAGDSVRDLAKKTD